MHEPQDGVVPTDLQIAVTAVDVERIGPFAGLDVVDDLLSGSRVTTAHENVADPLKAALVLIQGYATPPFTAGEIDADAAVVE